MYYHELVSMIARAIVAKSCNDLCRIEGKAIGLLLSADEMNAIAELIEAALVAVEDMVELNGSDDE